MGKAYHHIEHKLKVRRCAMVSAYWSVLNVHV